MNGFVLVLPILFIRYGLLAILGKEAMKRAAFYPPTEGIEKIAYLVYIITTLSLLIISLFIKTRLNSLFSFVGLGIYVLGMVLYCISIVQFAKPNENGLNLNGLYRISRNPMYLAFFLYFLGCSILTRSWLLLSALTLLQISVHYLILSEERWCISQFGEDYKKYMKQVRRYL
ncbi:methyltransferase family protein [Sporolactobacillus putidus]|uniref:Phospholipid methyltransferase n=1 Tax=Sporolactobacillus putidus TaxID=492735 RepID=A0A917RZE8_9BACL|nr:isoprenylcysteine carboxylmethyltransferase family protein [Sporolactobacillus putidus]GGL45095.1 phospholipid methyltransferase [Sporolactobacillus putidus]